ncbi:MAG TPA: Gldg family protein [bacterium]|nr:Gldg family protein [bacterium]
MLRRNRLLTVNALVSALLVAALLVGLNYLGIQHHVRWDLTATREHSLSPQTIKVLRSLPGPIQAVAFPGADSTGRYRDLLGTYQYYSKNFQYRLVDPDRNPAEAQRYKVTSYGQIVLQRGAATYTVDDATEDSLTNGLLHVLETGKKTVYVVQGDGEVPIDDFTRVGMGTVKQALTGKGFDVKPLFLIKEARVPADASAVILASPSQDLPIQVFDALDSYYRDGGHLLVLIDPQSPAGVRAWLGREFHVAAPGGIVIDPVSRLLGANPVVPIVTQYPFNDITQNFNLATAFPVATPLVPDAKTKDVTITPIVRSSDASYVKANLDAKDTAFQAGVDRKGPSVLGVEVTPSASGAPPASPAAVTPTARGGAAASGASPSNGRTASGASTPAKPAAATAPRPAKGSAVLFGNSSFIRNSYVGLVGNRDLFTSTVAWLTQSGNLVSIAPRASPFDPFIISGQQGRYLFLGSVIALPLALLVLGGSVYFRRRSL